MSSALGGRGLAQATHFWAELSHLQSKRSLCGTLTEETKRIPVAGRPEQAAATPCVLAYKLEKLAPIMWRASKTRMNLNG